MSSLTVLVVGATGSIGVHVVREALQQGHHVRALARDASRARDLPAEARGEAERVDYGGVRNVLTALGGRRVRVALMTAVGTTDRANDRHDWKRRAERLVRASGNAYTIARPGWFDYNSPDQRRIVMRQGDLYSTASPADGVIARDQIARVLVDSLRSTSADHKTFELVADPGGAQEDLNPVFSELTADTTLDGALDKDNMPLEEEPARVRDDLDTLGK